MRPRALVVFVLAFAVSAASVQVPAAQQRTTLMPPPADAAHNHDSLVAFDSNGCTGFREAKFFTCCFVHDFAYWAGGTRGERRHRDLELRQCLIDIGGTSLYDEIVADIGYLLVRMWNVPSLVLGPWLEDGWGRAWRKTKRSRYDTLTVDQRGIVEAERSRICSSLTFDKATGRYRLADARELAAMTVRRFCGEAVLLSHELTPRHARPVHH